MLSVRKMMAEFDNYTDVIISADNVYGTREPGDCRVPVPDYPNDPAAACSLLPKLYKATFPVSLNSGYNSEEIKDMALSLVEIALWDGEDAEVCRLIAEAIRKVKEVKQ
mgnify:CR=1 FL=1